MLRTKRHEVILVLKKIDRVFIFDISFFQRQCRKKWCKIVWDLSLNLVRVFSWHLFHIDSNEHGSYVIKTII